MIRAGRLMRAGRPDIAWRQVAGAAPVILFLPGYRSDMAGGKASAVIDWATAHGQGCILFDYAGCGLSAGDFAEQTLADWRDDAAAVLADRAPAGPVVLVGSSMGGWLALLLGERLGARLAGVIGLAAAPDFTDWGFNDEQKALLAAGETVWEDNPYGPDPTPTHPGFWQSGQALHVLDRPIAIDAPVRLIHGMADRDVPHCLAPRIAAAVGSADVQVTLVKDGDHRLSRAGDIALLLGQLTPLIGHR